jgi:hypothetical protein
MNPSLDELLNGFSIADLYVYRDSQEANLFYYLPDRPTPETNADQQPTLSLLAFDQTAILQFGVCWTATSDQLESLQTTLENKYPEIDRIRVSPAPIVIQKVMLYLHDRPNENRDLKTVSSSNYPPYTALFNTTLNAEEKDLAIAAIMGHEEILTVSYQAKLSIPISAEVKLTGNIQFDLAALPKSPSLSDCLLQIEVAIVAGRLEQIQTESEHCKTPESIALLQKAEKMVKEKAAIVLQTMAKNYPSDQSHFNTTVTLMEMSSIDLVQTSDISTWFPKQDGIDYIQTIG